MLLCLQLLKVTTSLHCVSKNVPTFDLLIFAYMIDYDNFWQKCYWESKKSDDALFSHLTYIMLQYYLAKEETQKGTAQWFIVRATVQPLQCSRLHFSWAMPPNMSQNWLKKSSSNWLSSGSNTAFEWKMPFSCFLALPGSAEAQVIWGGIVKSLLIAYFIGNISAKKISKSIHMCQSYSKPKVARFLRQGCITSLIF